MERLLKYLFPVLAFMMFAPIGANAQNGPMAPGYEKLRADMRQYAHVPLVLTPVSAPQKCLDMDRNDKTAKTILIWDCWIGWNQRVWFDNLSYDGAKDKVRIRIGNLACLNSSNRVGARAQMNICGDAPNSESFIIKDGTIIDNAGLCITLSAVTNGGILTSEHCNANEIRQKWKLDSMRAARSRTPIESDTDPSGISDDYILGHLPDVVEELRPRFTNRALSAAERDELKALTASWRRIKVVEIMRDSNLKAPGFIPWSTLKRLSELGETGDKEAMRAVMEAFVLSYRASSTYNSAGDWVEIGFEPNAFPHAENGKFARSVVNALSDLWGAHYWQRHGADPIAGNAFRDCRKEYAFRCMGYNATITGDARHYAYYGGKNVPIISNIVFEPTAGTPEQREGRFMAYLGGPYHYITTSDPDHEYFLVQQAVYAEKTGRFPLWDSVRLNGRLNGWADYSSQELFMRQTIAARADEKAWRTRFEAILADPSPPPYELGKIQAELERRGDASNADLWRYAERHEVWFPQLLSRLCGNGRDQTTSCQRTKNQMAATEARNAAQTAALIREKDDARRAAAAAQAQSDEAYRRQLAAQASNKKPSFADNLVSLAEGFAAAAEAGNQPVTVRKYDAAGNYIGSETMTRARAAGYGATPIK